jgi:hypothetical protein
VSTTILPDLPTTNLIGADIPTLISVLKDQDAQRLDAVVPRSSIRVNSMGNLEFATIDEVETTKPIITLEGSPTSFNPSGAYGLTANAEAQVAAMFKIPLEYLRRSKVLDPAFYAQQINEWAKVAEGANMLRLMWGKVEGRPELTGMARAIMSDKYKKMDNVDTLMSLLEGLTEAGDAAGIQIGPQHIQQISLTDSRMYIDINVPEIAINGRELVKGYHSPYTGLSGAELPLMNAGVRITNSETGKGRLAFIPRAMFQVCTNGMQMNAFGMFKTHLGTKIEEGVIDWSDATIEAHDQLIKSQVKDAVSTFLSTDFLDKMLTEAEKDAGVPVARPETTVQLVAKEMRYTDERADAILKNFMEGGKFTSGGLFQAVTATARDLAQVDPDAEYELASSAPQAMKVAAKVAS